MDISKQSLELNSQYSVSDDVNNIKGKFDQLHNLIDQKNHELSDLKTKISELENNLMDRQKFEATNTCDSIDYSKKMLKAGMLLDHMAKISTYRKKMKNGYAVDLYSAHPTDVIDKCDKQFENFATEFKYCNLKKPTESCMNVINNVIKCFTNTMDQYFDDTKNY